MSRENHNPIANIAAALVKWVDNSANHVKLAAALTAAKDVYAGTRTGGKVRLPELKRWTFTNENAKEAFLKLLEPKETSSDPAQHSDGWCVDGHVTWGVFSTFGCASINVLIMEQVILTFQKEAAEVVASDSENVGNITRAEYLNAHTDLAKGLIVPQRSAQEIHNAMRAIWRKGDSAVASSYPPTPRRPSISQNGSFGSDPAVLPAGLFNNARPSTPPEPASVGSAPGSALKS